MLECEELELDDDECAALVDAADSQDDTAERIFACAELDGRWCCRSFGASLPGPDDLRQRVCARE